MLNRIILIGRLTRDPELRYSSTGTAVGSFTLAVDRNNTNKDTDFIPIVTFKQTAEAVANYLRKGRLTAVEGRIQTRNYENNEGRRIYVTEVVADNVRFLEKADAGGQAQNPEQTSKQPDPLDEGGMPKDMSYDDLPF